MLEEINMEAIFIALLPWLGKLLMALGAAALTATITPNPNAERSSATNMLLNGINIVGSNWGKAGNHQERE